MVNCNPETVSTDYDTSDRLYFEPLTLEHVLEILRVEQENGTLHGVIVQFGGQTPLKLANALHDAGIPILGTTPDAIDLAEDRERFQALLHRLGLRQPVNGIARSPAEAMAVAKEHRLPPRHPPVLRPRRPRHGDRPRRRPAHPLHPRRRAGLRRHPRPPRQLPLQRHRGRRRRHLRRHATSTSPASWSTSRRPASTPATAPARSRPGRSTRVTIAELKRQTESMALALGVVGLMNVQFAIQDGDIYVLEVNPRASRTVPFVAKATDSAIAAIAARVMAGEPLSNFPLRAPYPAGHRPRRPPPLRRPADPRRPRHALVLGQGGGDALQPLPRRRHPARPRDALDRRGHGLGPHLPPRLPQGPARRRHRPPHHRHPLRLGQGRRQDRRPPRSRPHPARPRLPHPRHRRHRSASSPPTPSPPPASTRSTRAARTSSTPSRTAASRSSSTPPKAPSRSPTAAPSAR